MATLIACYQGGSDSRSTCVGRCDAKCYLATGPDCDCICGGRNHGVGLNSAFQNTVELAESWIEEYTQKNGMDSAALDWLIPEHQFEFQW